MIKFELKEFEKIKNSFISFKLGIIPTDTIYGYSCLIGDLANKQKIFELKKRPLDKELLIIVSDLNMMKEILIINNKIENVLKNNQNQPITIIGNKNKNYLYYDLLTKTDTVAIRIANVEWLKKLVIETGPIFSTSVNTTGENHLINPLQYKKNDVDFIVLEGILNNKPSKIYNSITDEWER